ncbi:MAG: YjbQ family protein [Thermoplasmata archaeon]|nr:MAG: YjbQ family protein [Thermoplasmata archaeon]
MSVHSEQIEISTKGEVDIIDITERVQEVVDRSGIKNGMALIFVSGSTGAITTIEYEPGLLHDLPRALERLFPKNIEYKHHETWHDGNGHSHVRASFLGPDLTVPVVNGSLALGTWQQIVFVELDVRRRTRRLIVQVMGE